MRCRYFFRAVAIKAKRMHKPDKKLAKSYVSLFLVMVLILTFSFAWFTKRNTARMGTNLLEFQSASSLRINKDKYSANKISIPAFTLDETSSVDGRNIYFPLGASFTTNTAEMFFREGNKGDEKIHYVYKDFPLKGTSGNTPVYIKSYKITVADPAGATGTDTSVNGIYQDELKVENDSNGKPSRQLRPPNHCPIRLAFIADSGVRPVVIDPSAQVVDYADNSNAVTLVDDNGVPQLQQTAADSFSTYYYEHTPLFVIPGGQTLNVTLVVWLEGTLENSDKYIGKEISVDIDIESNFAEMDTITFVDGSYGDTDSTRYWVSNSDSFGEPIIACSYEDPFSEETPKRWKTVIMRKTKDKTDSNGAEWQAEIPKKAYTNISFYRLTRQNGSNQATIYNAWHTRTGVGSMTNSNIPNNWYINGSLQESRRFLDTSTNTYDNSLVYTAVHGNKYSTTSAENERLSPCIGYWSYDPGSGSSSTGGGGQTGGGGGSTVTNCNLTVIARLPDSKTWVSATDTLGFETDAGNTYYFDNNNWIDNGKANQISVSIPVGEKIVRFCKKNSANIKYYPFSSGGTQTFTVPNSSTWTVTYTMDNNDHWSHN